MIFLALAVAALLVYGGISPDRVATPARAAARAGLTAGAGQAYRTGRARWTSGQPARADRHAQGKARLAGWRMPFGRRARDPEGNRTGARPTVPAGRWLNALTDGVQSTALAAGGLGAVAAREGWTRGRDGWRDARADHARARELGETSRWRDAGRIVSDTVRPPEGSFRRRDQRWWQRGGDAGHDLYRTARPRFADQHPINSCCGCGRATSDLRFENGETFCGACVGRHGITWSAATQPGLLRGRERRWDTTSDTPACRETGTGRHLLGTHGDCPECRAANAFTEEDGARARAAGEAYADAAEAERAQTAPPSGGGPATPKEIPFMATQTSTTVTPELTTVDDLLRGLDEMVPWLDDVMPTLKHYAAVSRLLPEASRPFEPDDETQAALGHLAGTAPDPDALGTWQEAMHSTLAAAKAFKAKGERLRGSGAKGDLQAAVGE